MSFVTCPLLSSPLLPPGDSISDTSYIYSKSLNHRFSDRSYPTVTSACWPLELEPSLGSWSRAGVANSPVAIVNNDVVCFLNDAAVSLNCSLLRWARDTYAYMSIFRKYCRSSEALEEPISILKRSVNLNLP